MFGVCKIQQLIEHPRVDNIAQTVQQELSKLNLRTAQGKSVAITAGSRGIPNLILILQKVVEQLKEAGAKPFLAPAMGSHGGATPAGQKEVLRSYGITEESVSCPIFSETETVQIGEYQGQSLFWLKHLWNADLVLVINRVKCHTNFVGRIESGLCKMIAVGCGGPKGAQSVHAMAQEIGLEQSILAVAYCILKQDKLIGGLAVIDNGNKETAFIEAVLPEGFIEHERTLLERAKPLLLQLPFTELDIVYLQEMGKNISGLGADPNVIGKKPQGTWRRELPRGGQAEIAHVCISSLTPESQGNAIGLSFADAVTTRLIEAINWEQTRVNARIGDDLELIEPPAQYPNDQEMLKAALAQAPHPPDKLRIVLAKNTSELKTIHVSETLLDSGNQQNHLQQITPTQELPFSKNGHLLLNL